MVYAVKTTQIWDMEGWFACFTNRSVDGKRDSWSKLNSSWSSIF
jgi:hypothetical protein